MSLHLGPHKHNQLTRNACAAQIKELEERLDQVNGQLASKEKELQKKTFEVLVQGGGKGGKAGDADDLGFSAADKNNDGVLSREVRSL